MPMREFYAPAAPCASGEYLEQADDQSDYYASQQMEAYRERLLTAALDYYERYGWVCVPVLYTPTQVIPPAGWQHWAKDPAGLRRIRPSMIRRYMAHHWDKLDGIAIALATSQYCHLDADSQDERAKLSRFARRLPHYQTARGWQFLVNLGSKRPCGCVDLRKQGFVGELRDGWELSVLPPSKHRNGIDQYIWQIAPPTEPLLPVSLRKLFLDASLAKTVNDKAKARKAAKIRHAAAAIVVDQVEEPSTEETSTLGFYPGVASVIYSTLPEMTGQRRSRLPTLLERLVRLKRDWSEIELRMVANRWWTLARSARRTNATTPKSTADGLVHLYRTYSDDHSSRLELAIAATQDSAYPVETAANLIQPKTKNANFRRKAVVLLATLCRELSLLEGGTFFLSEKDAARVFDGSPPQGRRLLELLVVGGYLKLLKKGTRGTYGLTLSTTYQWLGDQEPVLREAHHVSSDRSDTLPAEQRLVSAVV
jgi:hypothetical protein